MNLSTWARDFNQQKCRLVNSITDKDDPSAVVAAGSGAGFGPRAGAGAARAGLASWPEGSAPPSEAGRGACPPSGGGKLILRVRK